MFDPVRIHNRFAALEDMEVVSKLALPMSAHCDICTHVQIMLIYTGFI